MPCRNETETTQKRGRRRKESGQVPSLLAQRADRFLLVFGSFGFSGSDNQINQTDQMNQRLLDVLTCQPSALTENTMFKRITPCEHQATK